MQFLLIAAENPDWIDQLIRFGEWFFKTGSVYGLGFVLISALTAIFIVLCWKVMVHVIAIMASLREWVPRLAKGHWELMDTLKISIESLAQSHAADADTHALCQTNTANLGEALTRAADSWSRAIARMEKASN